MVNIKEALIIGLVLLALVGIAYAPISQNDYAALLQSDASEQEMSEQNLLASSLSAPTIPQETGSVMYSGCVPSADNPGEELRYDMDIYSRRSLAKCRENDFVDKTDNGRFCCYKGEIPFEEQGMEMPEPLDPLQSATPSGGAAGGEQGQDPMQMIQQMLGLFQQLKGMIPQQGLQPGAEGKGKSTESKEGEVAVQIKK